jgi:hypothetical protein
MNALKSTTFGVALALGLSIHASGCSSGAEGTGNGAEEVNTETLELSSEQLAGLERVALDLERLALVLAELQDEALLDEPLLSLWGTAVSSGYHSVQFRTTPARDAGRVRVELSSLRQFDANARVLQPVFEGLNGSANKRPVKLQQAFDSAWESVQVLRTTLAGNTAQQTSATGFVPQALRKDFCCVLEATGPLSNGNQNNWCNDINAFPRLADARCASWAALVISLEPHLIGWFDSVKTSRGRCTWEEHGCAQKD